MTDINKEFKYDIEAIPGERWFPKESNFEDDMNEYWGDWGVSSEVDTLKAVLLRRPGKEVEDFDPNAVRFSDEPLDVELMRKQHDDVAKIYSDFGAKVYYVEETRDDRPNAVFCRDLMFMTPEGAILTRPGMAARRGEERYVAQALAKIGVPILRTIAGDGMFEGANAMWVDRHTCVVSTGVRCNRSGFEQVKYELERMGVEVYHMQQPYSNIHIDGLMNPQYDKDLGKFGQGIIKAGEYRHMKAPDRNMYPEFGTKEDTLELRLDNNFKGGFQPIIRAHSGPYSDDMSRLAMLKEYQDWCHELGKAGFLDVLSIGSSQLSQSNFGENWEGKPNGGGVPVNSEIEYMDIWQAARPMLVRTYSGTKNMVRLAEIYERSINISWHALSLWWFNELDGRGPNALYDNLKEHLETIRYISTTGKPVETNVPHHFAFRGADDITYIVSGFLAAKAAKKYGTKTFVLQNMLNTPRSTWGIQDLAKGRTLLKLVKELEDEDFRVIL